MTVLNEKRVTLGVGDGFAFVRDIKSLRNGKM